MPRPGRFTVDDLRRLPDWGLRAEVVDGRLLLGPPASRRHDRVLRNLTAWVGAALPTGVHVHTRRPVRLPDGDGPVPDLVAAGADPPVGEPVPVADVHTAVEVVCADGRFVDRVWKRDRYAWAGVPCYWRVELAPWPGYRGRPPVIVVRVLGRAGWREVVAAAGQVWSVPVAYARGAGGTGLTVPVRLDPRALLVRRAAGR